MTVQDLLKKTLPRLQQQGVAPVVDMVSTVNQITDVLFRYLWRRESDLIESSTSLDFAVSAQGVDLPADFYGFAGMPYIVADEIALTPATKTQARALSDDSGYPEYFESKNGKLYLYPVTDQALSVLVDYYTRPVDVNALADALPFGGLFDRIFEDGAVRVQAEGAILEVDKDFNALLKKVVDDVLTMRDPACQQQGVEGYF